MSDFPVVLGTTPVLINASDYPEPEFTVYSDAQEFRQSLWKSMDLRTAIQEELNINDDGLRGLHYSPNTKSDEISVRALERRLAALRIRFDEAHHFDFSGQLKFTNRLRSGRVHAVLCFQGKRFSITLRDQGRPRRLRARGRSRSRKVTFIPSPTIYRRIDLRILRKRKTEVPSAFLGRLLMNT